MNKVLKKVRTAFNKDVRYVENSNPRRLDPECGRAQYQQFKKLMKRIKL